MQNFGEQKNCFLVYVCQYLDKYHSELMFIITRILLDHFGLKFTGLVKKITELNINRYFFIIYLAMVLASFCILASTVVLDPQALSESPSVGEAELTDLR